MELISPQVVFNDIDKQSYPASLPVIESKRKSGGLLIVDNLLWSGKIFDPGRPESGHRGDPELHGLGHQE